jgi:cyanophycinase
VSARAKAKGTLALVGGGEWSEGCRRLDEELLAASGADEVVVVPTAAAFERATAWFEALGAAVRPLRVLTREEAEDPAAVKVARAARMLYLADGSPMHLRSVLKDSALLDALLAAHRAGAVLAASGAGATVLCDPMVDPRGGAYTVGLGLVTGLAVFPYHGSAAAHLRERSIELLPRSAVLVGVDERTGLLRGPDGSWRAVGEGAVTVYGPGGAEAFRDEPVPGLP